MQPNEGQSINAALLCTYEAFDHAHFVRFEQSDAESVLGQGRGRGTAGW